MSSPEAATRKRSTGEVAGETPNKQSRQEESLAQPIKRPAVKRLKFLEGQESPANRPERIPVPPIPTSSQSYAQHRWEKESRSGGCFKCGHASHWVSECPFEHVMDARRDGQCFSCSKTISAGERIGLLIYNEEDLEEVRESKEWVHVICGLEDTNVIKKKEPEDDLEGFRASIEAYPEWCLFEKLVLQWAGDWCGHAIVTARAGCGKSELLIRTCSHVDKYLWSVPWILLVYNKAVQEELVKQGVPKAGAKTFHSIGRQVCHDHRCDFHPSKSKSFIDELVRACSSAVQDLAAQRCRQTLNSPFRSLAKRLASLAKDHLFVPPPWFQQFQQRKAVGCSGQRLAYCLREATPDSLHELVVERSLDLAYRDSDQRDEIVRDAVSLALAILRESLLCALGQSQLPDVERRCYTEYADMLYLPLVLGWRLPQFTLVMVDECQDSNPCSRAMVCEMLTEEGRCLAVGDPCQAIYEFTGADADLMSKLAQHLLDGTGLEVQDFELPISHRVPQRIADTVNTTFEAELGDVKLQSWVEGGTVVYDTDFAEESRRPKPGDGVLSRTNADLLGLRRTLLSKGIPCRMLGRKALAVEALEELGAILAKLKHCIVVGDCFELVVHAEVEKLKAGVDGDSRSTRATQGRIDVLMCLALLHAEMGGSVDRVRESLEADVRLNEEEERREELQQAAAVVTLATVHKAKGLQWPTVHLLQPKHLERSTAREESNCRYVAYTRAQRELRLLRHIDDKHFTADPALWMLPLFQSPAAAQASQRGVDAARGDSASKAGRST